VIARVWSARTTHDRAPRYAAYLRTHVFAELHALEGYERAELLQRDLAGDVEVQVVTYWRSIDAVRRFAGADVEAAVVTDMAASMLSDYDRRVRHYEIVLTDNG
jgi:heme-degrading monooxygenase HmoA